MLRRRFFPAALVLCAPIFLRAEEIRLKNKSVYYGEVTAKGADGDITLKLKKVNLPTENVAQVYHESKEARGEIFAEGDLVEVRLKSGTSLKASLRKSEKGYRVFNHDFLPDNYEIFREDIAELLPIGRVKVELKPAAEKQEPVVIEGQLLQKDKDFLIVANISDKIVQISAKDIEILPPADPDQKIPLVAEEKKPEPPKEEEPKKKSPEEKPIPRPERIAGLSYFNFSVNETYREISPRGFALFAFGEYKMKDFFFPWFLRSEIGYLSLSGSDVSLTSYWFQAGARMEFFRIQAHSLTAGIIFGIALENAKFGAASSTGATFAYSLPVGYQFEYLNFIARLSFRFAVSADQAQSLKMPGIDIAAGYAF